MRSEMDKTSIEGAFRCCALGTRKRLVVFSVCSYIINSIQSDIHQTVVSTNASGRDADERVPMSDMASKSAVSSSSTG